MTERETLPAAEFPLCMRHLLQPVWGDGAVSRKGLPGEVGLQSFSPFTSLAFLQLGTGYKSIPISAFRICIHQLFKFEVLGKAS